jgi:hypothetical protein
MVRRTGVANADGGAESSAYSDDPHVWPGTPGTDYPPPGRRASGGRAPSGRAPGGRAPGGRIPGDEDGDPGPKAPWSGSGGRWFLWPMRIVLWAALLIIVYRGITAIIMNQSTSSGNSTTSGSNGSNRGSTAAGAAATGETQFPVTLAEAYVMRFGRVYFNVIPGHAAQRQAALLNFLPSSVVSQQPQFGFTPASSLTLQSEDVAGIQVRSQQQAVVTLLATVNNQLMDFGVPVYAAGDGISISGLPALLPVPSAAQLPQAQQGAQDQVAKGQLQTQLAPFFRAYAGGNGSVLSQYVAAGASIQPLGQQVTFQSIQNLYVPEATGTRRDITVTVNWLLPGRQGGFATTYDMAVADQSDKWYVATISASTEPITTAP